MAVEYQQFDDFLDLSTEIKTNRKNRWVIWVCVVNYFLCAFILFYFCFDTIISQVFVLKCKYLLENFMAIIRKNTCILFLLKIILILE